MIEICNLLDDVLHNYDQQPTLKGSTLVPHRTPRDALPENRSIFYGTAFGSQIKPGCA